MRAWHLPTSCRSGPMAQIQKLTVRSLGALCLAGLVLACTASRETRPERTATEQLLISKAADDAADRLELDLPPGALVYLDPGNLEGSDGLYALGAVRDRILRDGARIAPDKEAAEIVVLVRAGALSIDENEMLIGIPEFDIPVPLAGVFTFPGLSLFKENRRVGVAKFAASAIDTTDGRLVTASDPRMGYSQSLRWFALLILSGRSDDLIPEDQPDERRASIVPDLP